MQREEVCGRNGKSVSLLLFRYFFSCGFRSFNHLLITKYRLLLPFGCVVKNIFQSVDETLKYDHSSESYWAVLSCGTVYYAVQGGSNFWVLCCIRWFHLFSLWVKSFSVTIQMKTYWAVLSCLLCVIWFISKSIRFFSIYALFIFYSGQPLHICNMQLSWKASWTNRNDGTSRLHCGLLWGNQWYVIKIHIETLQTALHTFLLRIVERIWFEIKVFSLWSSI